MKIIIAIKYNYKEIKVDDLELTVQPREIGFSKSTLKMYSDKTDSTEEIVEVPVDDTVTALYFRLMLNSTGGIVITYYRNFKILLLLEYYHTNGNIWELKYSYKKVKVEIMCN